MKEYKSEDGLRFLDYLGLIEFMQPEEIKEFEHWWKVFYEEDSNPIKTTYEIYTIILPVALSEGSFEKKHELCFSRMEEFKERMGMSIEEACTTGMTLDEILANFEKNARVS